MSKQATFHTISIVIPLFNEERTIVSVLERVAASDTLGLEKEILIVDDGSTDNSLAQIRKYIASHTPLKKRTSKQSSSVPKIKCLTLPTNQGKCAAVKAGLLDTTGDIVLIQDADLEYSPDDYPKLLQPFFMHHADAVYGSRFISGAPHRVLYFWHFVANACITTLSNIFTNLNLTDMETGSKVFKGDVIRSIAPKLESKRFGFEPEITARLAKYKAVIYEVGITYQGRTYEEGKKIGWKDGVRAIWEIIKYNVFD